MRVMNDHIIFSSLARRMNWCRLQSLTDGTILKLQYECKLLSSASFDFVSCPWTSLFSFCFKKSTWGKCAFVLTDETEPYTPPVCLVCQERSPFYIMKRSRRTLKHHDSDVFFQTKWKQVAHAWMNECYLIMNINVLVGYSSSYLYIFLKETWGI